MKNNKGKGLYEIGETNRLPCGCLVVANKVGYTQFINPECKFDNRIQPKIPNYYFKAETVS